MGVLSCELLAILYSYIVQDVAKILYDTNTRRRTAFLHGTIFSRYPEREISKISFCHSSVLHWPVKEQKRHNKGTVRIARRLSVFENLHTYVLLHMYFDKLRKTILSLVADHLRTYLGFPFCTIVDFRCLFLFVSSI